ncbi:TPA: hypothetical protein ACH3X3_007299 [Trebouxia sp. C0006]
MRYKILFDQVLRGAVSVAYSNYTGFCIYQSRMQGGLSLQTRHIQCVRPCAFDRRVQQNCIRLHKRPVRAFSAKANGKADVFTLLLDCDGVLVDTEAQGHRVSFNEAFKQKGLDFEWSVEAYGNLLAIGGGKERMSHYFTAHSDSEPFSSMQVGSMPVYCCICMPPGGCQLPFNSLYKCGTATPMHISLHA